MTEPVPVCQNCGETDGVRVISLDMDLPALVLCKICTILLITDPEAIG